MSDHDTGVVNAFGHCWTNALLFRNIVLIFTLITYQDVASCCFTVSCFTIRFFLNTALLSRSVSPVVFAVIVVSVVVRLDGGISKDATGQAGSWSIRVR